MFLVPYLFICQFYYKLHAGNGAKGINNILKACFIHHIVLHQPQIIQVFEFRQEIFAIKAVVVEIMAKCACQLMVFKDRKVIIPFLFFETDLYLMIDAEIHSKKAVDLPAKLVIFFRCHDPQ